MIGEFKTELSPFFQTKIKYNLIATKQTTRTKGPFVFKFHW